MTFTAESARHDAMPAVCRTRYRAAAMSEEAGRRACVLHVMNIWLNFAERRGMVPVGLTGMAIYDQIRRNQPAV